MSSNKSGNKEGEEPKVITKDDIFKQIMLEDPDHIKKLNRYNVEALFLLSRRLDSNIWYRRRYFLFKQHILFKTKYFVYLITFLEETRKRTLEIEEKRSKIAKYEWEKRDISKNWVKDIEKGLIKISKEYLEGSGLAEKDMIIYPRDDFKKEWEFINKEVIKESAIGWILGSPGTGKSIASYSLLLNLNIEGWIVTWIHLSREDPPLCIQLNEGYKYTQILKDYSTESIRDILYSIEKKKHIVFIDGYTSFVKHFDFFINCKGWLRKNYKMNNSRLVIICSMASRKKGNLDHEIKLNIKELFINSWKLEEYYKAIEYKEFFESIKDNLDSYIPLNEELTEELIEENVLTEELIENIEKSKLIQRKELIYSKYYFAGGSARLMFGYKTNLVISLLDQSIESVNDVTQYIEGTIGDLSDSIINRLFNIYIEEREKRDQ